MDETTPETNPIEDSHYDVAHQLLVTPDSRVWVAVSGEVQLREGRVWVAVHMPGNSDFTYVEIKSEVRITRGLLWIPVVTKEFEFRKPEELVDPTCSSDFFEYRKLTESNRAFTSRLGEVLSDKHLADDGLSLDSEHDDFNE